jgi:hypothetical protein
MTSIFLFLSDVFKWSFGFFEAFGYLLNWILFIVASIIFIYWCWELVVPLGNNKDRDYKTPSKVIRPYYDPEVYKTG